MIRMQNESILRHFAEGYCFDYLGHIGPVGTLGCIAGYFVIDTAKLHYSLPVYGLYSVYNPQCYPSSAAYQLL